MKLLAKAVVYVAFIWLAVMSLQRVRMESSRPSAHERKLAKMDDSRERPAGEGDATASTNAAAGLNANAAAAVVPTGSGVGALTNLAAGAAPGAPQLPAVAGQSQDRASALGLWIAVFVVALLSLAGLVGWDLTQWFAGRTNRALGVDVQGPPEKPPEYELAEEEWAKGNHLDAITMMRDYLSRNPSEQYVALRIAEIYEKDLGNSLAAALEYEEVLNCKLPREKWGWTALRLSNLYSGRLNQPERAIATLERVIAEYPETAAAKKARERLGVPEPTEEPVGEMDVNPVIPQVELTAEEEAESSTLPAGFRRKK